MQWLRNINRYLLHLTTYERILYWIGSVGGIVLLVGTLWLILNDENVGDGSKYLWIFPIALGLIPYTQKLIIKGMRKTEQIRDLSYEEKKNLAILEESVQKYQEVDWNKHSRYQDWLKRVYIVFLGIVILFFLFLSLS